MSDLVKLLRQRSDARNFSNPDFLCGQAADEIERLQDELAPLKDFAEEMAKALEWAEDRLEEGCDAKDDYRAVYPKGKK